MPIIPAPPIGRYYAYDPLPYNPPVSYTPSQPYTPPPVSYNPPVSLPYSYNPPVSLPYYGQPISPESPISKYYAYDTLPYNPPVSYTPSQPYYNPPVSYEPKPIFDNVLVKDLRPIFDYSNNNYYGGSVGNISYGGGGANIGYGGNTGGGGTFFGNGGDNWMTDWGFGTSLTSGSGRKGSIYVPPTDYDEYGNSLWEQN